MLNKSNDVNTYIRYFTYLPLYRYIKRCLNMRRPKFIANHPESIREHHHRICV